MGAIQREVADVQCPRMQTTAHCIDPIFTTQLQFRNVSLVSISNIGSSLDQTADKELCNCVLVSNTDHLRGWGRVSIPERGV